MPGTWQGIRDAGRTNVEDKPYYQPMTILEMERFYSMQFQDCGLQPGIPGGGDVNLAEDDVKYNTVEDQRKKQIRRPSGILSELCRLQKG